ncbi:MAG: group 1 glycosyl transferase [Bacteroidetes bacterium]|nr:MAG: group 1 glycosyl transferase [Bacteroidota bacterium]
MINKHDYTSQNSERFCNVPGIFSINSPIVRYMSRSTTFSMDDVLPEILVITTYPPKECGIATYSQDLIQAIDNKFRSTFSLKVCALEVKDEAFTYDDKVKYMLDTSDPVKYSELAEKINSNKNIKIVLSQHEFGFYNESQGADFIRFLQQLTKPVITAFHTVLPRPDALFKQQVINIVEACNSVIVMTYASKAVLEQDYGIPSEKIEVIAHGTHLVSNNSKAFLKEKYALSEHKVLSTFGLMSSGKGIETTLDALPLIIKTNPEVMFLIIGKTHPQVIKNDGEVYRQMLEKKIVELKIENHVRFVNQYLSLPVLLEYLRLTDIYLFTSIDPNQAVSGTFSYAMSCGCALISTPIPQAIELLDVNTGIIIDFHNPKQLADGVKRLLNDEPLRKNMGLNTLHKIAPTTWENSAIAHALLIEKTLDHRYSIQYSPPEIKLDHLKHMTTDVGLIQFSKINQPDIETGYTLDDNARALVTMCMHYELTHDKDDLKLIETYVYFIQFCQQKNGDFLNYVNKDKEFTLQNTESNLDDANGRAIWALGYLLSLSDLIPAEMLSRAEIIFERSLIQMETVFSPRAMAFAIKGLYYYLMSNNSPDKLNLLITLANRLVQMYKHESSFTWNWFEEYLTYANSILSEAMLNAWILTGKEIYKEIATSTFDFLLATTFNENGIEVISNNKWFVRGQIAARFGEQPIDVAYTIMTLSKFYNAFKEEGYRLKMETAFNWFLGNNRLHQIIYNPCTGGCYDGLEEHQVNLNQGAESTVSYLMARLTIEKYRLSENPKHRWIQSRKLTQKSLQ